MGGIVNDRYVYQNTVFNASRLVKKFIEDGAIWKSHQGFILVD